MSDDTTGEGPAEEFSGTKPSEDPVTGPPFTEDLWLDRVTRKLGFGWLAEQLPRNLRPSLVYTLVALIIIEPTLNYLAYRAGEPIIYVANPYFLLQPVALIAAIYGSYDLRRRYHNAMHEMEVPERSSNSEQLMDIVPRWLPWAFFLTAVVVNFGRVLARGGFTGVYQDAGISAVIAWGIVNPFIWAAIASQFLAVYLSIEIRAPRRLANSDIGIHFRDPEGLGGLRPIGELLKHAYYYLMAGLIAYALIMYTPFVTIEEFTVTGVAKGVFTIAWIGTVVTVGFGVYILHRYMHREKRRQLRRLEQQANKYIDNPWDISSYAISEEKQDQVDDIQARMDQVSNTNEYPATFTIWTQLLVSILLPKAIQLALVA